MDELQAGVERPRRRWSFAAVCLVLLMVLLALQAVPVIGVFLMIVGAPFVAGLLVHAILLGMLIESRSRRIPRILMVVPVAAYGGY